MKKHIRFLALALALILSLGVLASCNGGGGGNTQTGGRGEDGSWDDVNFGGNELVVMVSANKPSETTLGASSAYTKGPDKTSSDNVQKKVYERNRDVANMLNISVTYKTNNLGYSEVLADIEKLVQQENGPDVYVNDIYGLLRAMFNGYLQNLLDFGTNADGSKVQNFFDFSYDGWYADYMKGATLDAKKQYLMAGDYFIDLIRFAWCIFVNVTEYDATFAELQDWVSYDYTARRIDFAGEWTYDDLVTLATKAHQDSTNKGTADMEDERLGLLINSVTDRIALFSSGVSMVEWHDANGAVVEQGYGTPVIVGEPGTDPATKNMLSTISEAYKKLYNGGGVFDTSKSYSENAVKEATDQFINGKTVFSTIILGEMESDSMREVAFTRGILPFPKYSSAQENFLTVVHDQAEIGAILANAKSPTMASAYMQALNEASSTVLTEYYEKSLKIKYNTAGDSEGGVRLMIDLVHDTIDSPFESVISNYICGLAGGDTTISLYQYMTNDAKNNGTAFGTKYNAAIPALQSTLQGLFAAFNERLK